MANHRISSEQLLEMLNDDGVINTFLMTDEAHFHLSGYVNKQNYRYWAPENPQELHQRPLHSERLTVWCGIASFRVLGPYFFEDNEGAAVTVTSERYVAVLWKQTNVYFNISFNLTVNNSTQQCNIIPAL